VRHLQAGEMLNGYNFDIRVDSEQMVAIVNNYSAPSRVSACMQQRAFVGHV
jgi:hypothetical protein